MKIMTLCAGAIALLFVAASANAAGIKQYKTEKGAQNHCPKDAVVWGSVQSGVYHTKGSRFYGKTKDGRYVCMGEADKAGMHAAANNQ
jgi:hypothetical protein